MILNYHNNYIIISFDVKHLIILLNKISILSLDIIIKRENKSKCLGNSKEFNYSILQLFCEYNVL